jgi:hypothetical protein
MRNAERGNGRTGVDPDLEGETEAGPETGVGGGSLAVWRSWVKVLGGGGSGVRPLPTLHGKVRIRGDFGVGRRCKRLGERGLRKFFGAPRGGAQVERCVYLAIPSGHPRKKLRPLSPNDLQRFPSENTAHPRTFRCRVGRGCHPERNRHQRGSSPMNCPSNLKFNFPAVSPIGVHSCSFVVRSFLPLSFSSFWSLRSFWSLTSFPALAPIFPRARKFHQTRKSMAQITSINVQ